MLSPKQIVPICFAISFIFSAPSFADPDISSSASSADCKHTPLQVYSGTSNLQANWSANEIELSWYDGDELLDDIPDESWSCVYDGTLTPPPAPTKTGYTFKGWRVRHEILLYDVVDTSINGTDYGYASVNGGDAYNANAYGLTSDSESGEWAVTFSYGIIKGKAYCSAWKSDYSGTQGPWCVCQATRYIPPSGENTYGVKEYVHISNNKNSLSACESGCAQYCAEVWQTDSDARARAFR